MTNQHDTTLIHTIVELHLGADSSSITPLKGGFFSRAFIASSSGREYVVRINAAAHALESFEKDDYAWRHFASEDLPVPRVVAFGEAGGEWYAVSERLPGVTLSGLPTEERDGLFPVMVETLVTISNVDISASHGFGDWDGTGNGRHERWADYLAQIMEDEPEGYYANWHAVFDETFLERGVYEAVYRKMMGLIAFCPDTRALIHNDLQFENVLSDGRRITGVIDWANALYGDPLYDVARWFWWTGTYGWFGHGADLLRERFHSAPSFDERIACYQCHIGLDDLKFCAKNGMHEWYNIHRDRLRSLVGAWPKG